MKKKWYVVLSVILLAIFISSTCMLLIRRQQTAAGEEAYQEAVAIALERKDRQQDPVIPTETEPTAPAQIHWVPASIEETDPNLDTLRAIDLAALREVNPQVLGWILIPDTNVNYPLLQGEDNQYYLNHTWNHARNYVGAIFLEHQNSSDFTDYNTIIYGHNLRNDKMFSVLRKYTQQAFYDSHPYVYLVTDQGIFRYEIFSCHLAAVGSESFGMVMQQDQTRQAFLDQVLAESVVETTVVPTVMDPVITLSTCTGRGHADRWVIHARLEMIPITQ